MRWLAKPRQREALIAVGFLLLSVAWFAATWRSPFDRLPTIPSADALQYVWFTKWFQWALTHGRNPLVSVYANYPTGLNLMWNTGFPALAVAVAPITAAFGPVFGFNVLATLALATSGYCAYLAIRRYVRSRAAAIAGGIAFAFCPFMAMQSQVHMFLTFVPFLPLLLLLMDEILVRQRQPMWRMGVLLGLLCAVQVLVAEEVLVLAAVAVVVGGAALLAVHRRLDVTRVRYIAGAGLIALGVLVLLAFIPVAYQFLGPDQVRTAIHPPELFSTDLVNFILPTSFQAVAPSAALEVVNSFRGFQHEQNGYIGIRLLAAAAVGIWVRRKSQVAWVTVVALGGVSILSPGGHLHVAGQQTRIKLPGLVFQKVGLLANLLPSRLMLVADLFAAVIFAILVDIVLGSRRTTYRVLGAVMVVAVVVAWLPKVPAASAPLTSPSLFTPEGSRQIKEGDVVFILPGGATAMFWQATSDMRFKIAQGYVNAADPQGNAVNGPYGSALNDLTRQIQMHHSATPVTPAVRASVLDDISARQVSTVIVYRPPADSIPLTQFFIDVTGKQPVTQGDFNLWRTAPD